MLQQGDTHDPYGCDAGATAPAHGVVIASAFRPAWWCRGAHAQTLWPHIFRIRPRPAYRRERLELPDGDFLDLDWLGGHNGPIAMVLPGLQGSSTSHYVRGIASSLTARGLRVLVMHFRGCSGTPNRLPRSYHSGETGDLAVLVEMLQQREPGNALAAIGCSLGGNVLLKWLGETGAANPLTAAVAVSVPFDLGLAADRMEHGWSQLYQWHLVRSLHRSTAYKFKRIPCPLDLSGLTTLRTFREFDGDITAPLHGFADAEDYYRRCSSRPFLRHIRITTLILHARDDPLSMPEAVPTGMELGADVTLELSARGGHAGYVGGVIPGRTRYWLDQRIPSFLDAALRQAPGQPKNSRHAHFGGY